MKENRYKLPTDKLVNRLVPYYLSGRKYILFLQSLVYPLHSLSEKFRAFAAEKHIEVALKKLRQELADYLPTGLLFWILNI